MNDSWPIINNKALFSRKCGIQTLKEINLGDLYDGLALIAVVNLGAMVVVQWSAYLPFTLGV